MSSSSGAPGYGKYAWPDIIELGGYDLLEFFSGVGRIATVAHCSGYLARGYEILHDIPASGDSRHSGMPRRSAFDMNGEAGFLCLGVSAPRAQTITIKTYTVCHFWNVKN